MRTPQIAQEQVMQAYIDRNLHQSEPRRHPWTVGKSDSFRYYDFKKEPDLIPHVLEDFSPYVGRLGIEGFFDFLRWVNGPQSIFESNDCATRPPKDNVDPTSRFSRAMMGRVMLLFRDLKRNLYPNQYDMLFGSLLKELKAIDPAMTKDQGVFGLVLEKAVFDDVITNDAGMCRIGHQCTLMHWVWGENDAELFQNLGRMYRNLTEALQVVGTRMSSLEIA